MTRNEQRASSVAVTTNRPYRASWLNHLLNRIESLPGPAWPYYLLGFILVGLLSTLASWLLGEIPVGEMAVDPFLNAIYPTYFVALMYYLDGEARSALAKFRPILHVDDAGYSRIEYELTVVPALGAWFALALAIVPGISITLGDYAVRLDQPNQVAGIAVQIILTIFAVASLFILVYHTLRQLRLVSRIHAAATTINLFQPWPAYAFSQLTARVGMGLLLFTYFSFVFNPPSLTSLLSIVLTATPLLVASLAFLLPLLGMHRRLVLEKTRLESEVNQGIEIAHKELQERVHLRNFAHIEELDKLLSSLISLREVVIKLSTWPWHAETLRGFISALLIPIILWVITKILDRLVVF